MQLRRAFRWIETIIAELEGSKQGDLEVDLHILDVKHQGRDEVRPPPQIKAFYDPCTGRGDVKQTQSQVDRQSVGETNACTVRESSSRLGVSFSSSLIVGGHLRHRVIYVASETVAVIMANDAIQLVEEQYSIHDDSDDEALSA